jgi:hypothetical protein
VSVADAVLYPSDSVLDLVVAEGCLVGLCCGSGFGSGFWSGFWSGFVGQVLGLV